MEKIKQVCQTTTKKLNLCMQSSGPDADKRLVSKVFDSMYSASHIHPILKMFTSFFSYSLFIYFFPLSFFPFFSSEKASSIGFGTEYARVSFNDWRKLSFRVIVWLAGYNLILKPD